MIRTLLSAAASLLFVLLGTTSRGQGTAFTYQGHLEHNGSPGNDTFDFLFRLYDASTNGTQIGGNLSLLDVPVSNGLFVVTLDFGPGMFTGSNRWLQIGARTATIRGIFTTLLPRQLLTPTPYAIFAENVASGGISASQLNTPAVPSSGQVLGFNGASLVWTNPAAIASAWSLNGNSGTIPGANFVGTLDNVPLDLYANGLRGLRLEYDERTVGTFHDIGINVNGGFWSNAITGGAVGATIAGGGYLARKPTLGDAYHPNTVNSDFGTVGGGYGNTAGFAATVPGGVFNTATGQFSFAAGSNAQATANGNFVWSDGSQGAFSGTGANCFDVLASGGVYLYNGAAGLTVDSLSANNGTLNYGLRFGFGSGEGIASKKTSGGNQDGLDFYTAFARRVSITSSGLVGIGTTSPQQQLDVSGQFIVVRGSGNEQAYMGGDGAGNDVQFGSLNASVVNAAFYNPTSRKYLNLAVATLSIVGGSDLAEPFPMTEEEISEGSVVIIDEKNPGQLKLSNRAYDTHVAGVVSGANGVKPGISLKQKDVLEGGRNVALSGRVYVKADASNGEIHPGDLLTTSAIAGQAMKVTEHARAQGAILGKAMSGLKDGQGMVLMLVTLE